MIAGNRELDVAGVTEPIKVVLGDAGYCTEAVSPACPTTGRTTTSPHATCVTALPDPADACPRARR